YPYIPAPATTDIYTLSLHDALPISPILRTLQGAKAEPSRRPASSGNSPRGCAGRTWILQARPFREVRKKAALGVPFRCWSTTFRSEEHTSELQSRENLVCRLLLEKK